MKTFLNGTKDSQTKAVNYLLDKEQKKFINFLIGCMFVITVLSFIAGYGFGSA